MPDHAGGAETLAFRLDVPILAAPGASAVLSSELVAIEGADVLGFADVEIRVHATPGTHPDHLAFELPSEGAVLVGDLFGPGPSRSIPEPVDEDALRRSRARVTGLGLAAGRPPLTRRGRDVSRRACRPSGRRPACRPRRPS